MPLREYSVKYITNSYTKDEFFDNLSVLEERFYGTKYEYYLNNLIMVYKAIFDSDIDLRKVNEKNSKEAIEHYLALSEMRDIVQTEFINFIHGLLKFNLTQTYGEAMFDSLVEKVLLPI